MKKKGASNSSGKSGVARNNSQRLEAKLDKGIRAMIGTGPDDYSPEDWRSVREQFRLNVLYVGRFVAFRDHYEGEGDTRRLIQREVVASSKSFWAFQKRLAALPDAVTDHLGVDYVEPPGPGWIGGFIAMDGQRDS
jgi:hypothetical protein